MAEQSETSWGPYPPHFCCLISLIFRFPNSLLCFADVQTDVQLCVYSSPVFCCLKSLDIPLFTLCLLMFAWWNWGLFGASEWRSVGPHGPKGTSQPWARRVEGCPAAAGRALFVSWDRQNVARKWMGLMQNHPMMGRSWDTGWWFQTCCPQPYRSPRLIIVS